MPSTRRDVMPRWQARRLRVSLMSGGRCRGRRWPWQTTAQRTCSRSSAARSAAVMQVAHAIMRPAREVATCSRAGKLASQTHVIGNERGASATYRSDVDVCAPSMYTRTLPMLVACSPSEASRTWHTRAFRVSTRCLLAALLAARCQAHTAHDTSAPLLRKMRQSTNAVLPGLVPATARPIDLFFPTLPALGLAVQEEEPTACPCRRLPRYPRGKLLNKLIVTQSTFSAGVATSR